MADEKIVIDIEVEKIKADATSLQAQVTELENSLHFGESLEQPVVSEMFDIDSAFAKIGVLAQWRNIYRNAGSFSKPFVMLFKDLQDLTDNPTSESIQRMDDFSKINFPSKYNSITAIMMSAIAEIPRSTEAIEMLIRSQNELQAIPVLEASDDVVDQARAAFLKANNEVMAQTIMRGAIVSDEDVSRLNSLWQSWVNAATQKHGIENGSILDRRDYGKRAAEDKALLLAQRFRLDHLNTFGLTEESVRNKDGYAAAGFFDSSPLSSDVSNAF